MTLAVNSTGSTNKTGLQRASFLFLALIKIGLLLLLSGCEQGLQKYSFSGATMGTSYHVTLVAEPEQVSDDLEQQLQSRLDQLNQTFSTYLVDSELNQLNRSPLGKAFSVTPDLMQVLVLAKQTHQQTNGAFNPAVGPLVDLWGFGSVDTGDQIPSQLAIEEHLRAIDLSALALDVDQNKVVRQQPIRLDLSAIAKGYAVDQLTEFLLGLGLSDCLVEVGGELRLSGRNQQGELWRIGVKKPDPDYTQTNAQVLLRLTDVAIATSGDYRNYFEKNGRRYSHTIDPRTGRPVEHNLASVTVVTDNAARADALATAYMVMGLASAINLANQQEIAAYFIVKEGDGFVARLSTAFVRYVGNETLGDE